MIPQSPLQQRPFALLTKDQCPNCERLKMMLAGPLKGQFDHLIERVHKESDEERFAALAQAHGVSSAPALIRLADGARPRTLDGLGEVKRFLQEHA